METVNSRSYILVTGGAGGIGSAVCKLLPNIGITPIVGFNTNSTQAHTLAKELNGFAVKIDMNIKNSIEEAIQIIINQLKEADKLAGVVLGASPPPDILSFLDINSDHLLNQFQVNVIGSQILLKGLIKNFYRKKKMGTVIGILTQAIGTNSQLPATGMGAYIIAKGALKTMLSVCAAEYPWLKVRTINPSFTKTKMLDVFDPRYLDILDYQKKISTPQKIAQLIIKEITN